MYVCWEIFLAGDRSQLYMKKQLFAYTSAAFLVALIFRTLINQIYLSYHCVIFILIKYSSLANVVLVKEILDISYLFLVEFLFEVQLGLGKTNFPKLIA